MRALSNLLRSAALVSTLALGSCSKGYFGNPPYLAVTISPRPVSVAVGQTVVLTGTVSNNLSLPTWSLLNAADTPNIGTLSAVAGANTSISYTAPSVTAEISPTTASVPLNGTLQFSGYAVGSVDNAVVWQVNGVAGGSTTAGTITTTGLYIAPATLPMTGNSVTILLVSHADPTKSASAVVSLH